MIKNYCAQVVNGSVVAIIVGDYEWTQANLEGDWHDLGPEPLEVGIGWLYDSTSNTFSAPPPPPEPKNETL